MDDEILLLLDDPDALDALTPEEQIEYLRLLEQRLEQWSLDEVPRTRTAHLLAGKVDWTMMGGAAGGSKTEGLLYHARDLAVNVPGSHILILRTSKPELRRSIVLRSIARFRQTGDDKRAKLRAQDNVLAWWFDNGSIIEMGYLKRDEDVGQYMSAEYALCAIDESTQFTPYQITMLAGRLRVTREQAVKGARPHLLMATNPGDVSHEWHYDLFVETTSYGEWVVVLDISEGFHTNEGDIDWDKVKIVQRVPAPKTPAEAEAFTLEGMDPENHLSIAFVPFKATDNPFLDPSVMKGLNALPEMERKQKRDGDWDTFTGRFFTEFSHNTHVKPQFTPPASWDHCIGIDHGYSAPFAALFVAWDPDGTAWCYDEAYMTKLTPQQQAAEVKSRMVHLDPDSGKVVKVRFRTPQADPAVFSNKGEGVSIGEQWRAAGLNTAPASNARIDGWVNVREYMRVPIMDDGVGVPKLYVMDNCVNLIRELRNARMDKTRHDDVDTRGDDHLLDCLRYVLAVRPRRGKKVRDTFDRAGTKVEQMVSAELFRMKRSARAQERRLRLNE